MAALPVSPGAGSPLELLQPILLPPDLCTAVEFVGFSVSEFLSLNYPPLCETLLLRVAFRTVMYRLWIKPVPCGDLASSCPADELP